MTSSHCCQCLSLKSALKKQILLFAPSCSHDLALIQLTCDASYLLAVCRLHTQGVTKRGIKVRKLGCLILEMSQALCVLRQH